MKFRFWIAAAVLAFAVLPALASEATFDRTFNVTGRVDLSVSTGSGNIHLISGPDNRVHIFGRVRPSWGAGNDSMVQQIAANPPLQQTGNIIRVGKDQRNLHNISIDYEIEAPANAFLAANSGSGNITDDGIGDNAKLSTGSGNIHATGLQRGFYVNTGSGNIYAEQVGTGDAHAQTGSGSIELRNVTGALRAGTGSGSVKVSGSPTNPWHVETGSGSIEFWPGNTGFLLDASTGSGGIHIENETLKSSSTDRHHVVGSIKGGGPRVRLETGSGSIRIH
ncbi:MAG TPA: DUF4097 family beta strand repeat-containing protein [Terracidiphilus sp.]|nr:DUF4097 family beta strand repeat-containing protein [Terracidiphilus sp.]